jgi:signal transduction histidine kinase
MPNATLFSQDTLLLSNVIIRDAQDAFVVADAQGTICSINAAGAQSLGLSVGEAVGVELPEALRGTLAQLQSEGATRSPVEWPDGNTFQATLVPTPGRGALIVFHNAARFKQRDWIELVAVVSHDLKSPLAVLTGYAHVLAESPELSPLSRGHVRAVIENAERMRDLIESLLDLAQVEAGLGGEVESCDLVRLIGSVQEMLERQAQDKQQTLTFNLLPLSNVVGNPVRLTQVVCNLVGNAIKYTPPGGSVQVAAEQRDREVCFYVRDNGPGIPPDAQAKLFQRFYRVGGAKGGAEGTGLGLAIVKSIVESYGGRVWVESQAGQGSTFGAALPVERIT